MLYILNEREYIRNILVSKNKSDELPMGYFITLIAKYYYAKDLDVQTLSDIVKKKISEFHIENYQEYKYHDKITCVCRNLFDGGINPSLKEREYIPIYENELKLINSLDNDRQKKLMFTLFTVARYMECDGWINKKDAKGISEVFKLANITLTSDKRNELLHELYHNGYISFGKKINNLNIKVQLDDTGDIVYKVKDFKNIGNQYIGNFKKGYRQCRNINCGSIFKIHSKFGRPQQYCKKCSIKIDRDKARERMKDRYEEQKNVL